MTINSTPNSHIQLLVPESYLFGGAITDEATTANAFDGDVDSSITLPATSTVKWTYPSALSKPVWTLVYRHYGDNSCVYKITHDATDIAITSIVEEDRGQVARDWQTTTPAFSRDNSSAAFSNLLIEHNEGDVVAATINRFNITTGSGLSNLREVIFSRDYRVPMYNKSWSASYEFKSKTGKTLSGIQSPRFNLRNTYVMSASHSFEWTHLTAAEKLVFEFFIRAFGGNMMRPFAMCIIHGTPAASETINNVMTTRMLLIDSESISWSRDQDTQRHGLKFNATELIPL